MFVELPEQTAAGTAATSLQAAGWARTGDNKLQEKWVPFVFLFRHRRHYHLFA